MTHTKNFLLLFLLTSSTSIFSALEITAGKEYRNKKTGQIIRISQSCKEAWGVEGLTTVGDYVRLPAILDYLCTCSKESGKMSMLQENSDQFLSDPNPESFKAFVDEKFLGPFYYGKEGSLGKCVHESWLEPLE